MGGTNLTKRILIFLALLAGVGLIQTPAHSDAPPHPIYLPTVLMGVRTPQPPIVQQDWLWLDPTIYESPAPTEIRIFDWDGDGKNEVYVRKGAVLAVYGYGEDEQFDFLWGAFVNHSWGFCDWDGDGVTELWTRAEGVALELYQPFAARPERRYLPIDYLDIYGYGDIAITDLFGNGEQVLVAFLKTQDYQRALLRAYHLPDLQLIWEYEVRSVDACERLEDCTFTIAQVDNDPAQEIILKHGSVIDPTSSSLQWFFEDGFGDLIYPADVDSDGVEELLIRKYDAPSSFWQVAAIDVAQQRELWEMTLPNCLPYGMLVEDSDADGELELLLACGTRLKVYDLETRTLEWEMVEAGASGAIAVGDVRNGGKSDILWWGCRHKEHRCEGFEVFWSRASEHVLAGQITPNIQPNYRPLSMQIDDDDAREIVIVGNGGYPSADLLRVFDGRTKRPQSNEGLESLWPISHADKVLSCQTDADVYHENIIQNGPLLRSIDHDGKALAAQRFNQAWHPLWTADVDGDGNYELGSTKQYYKDGISLRDARTLDYRWQTMDVDALLFSQPFDIDDDGVLELTVSKKSDHSLIMLDGVTKKVDWSMRVEPFDVRGAYSVDIAGDAAPELVLLVADHEHTNRIRTYDIATKRLLTESAPIPPGINDFQLFQLKDTPYPQLAIVQLHQILLYEHPADRFPSQIISVEHPGCNEQITGQVFADDIDGDGKMELIVPHVNGVSIFTPFAPTTLD